MRGAPALEPLRRLGPVALCALTAHAVLYRSLFPSDGVHGYFGWYEPAVAALSLASAATVGAAAIAALLGRRSRLLGTLRTTPTVPSAVRLASFAIGWLVVQETVEGSVSAGSLQLATFSVGGWSIIVGATTIAAGALTMLARVGIALVGALAPTPPRVARLVEGVRRTASVPPKKRHGLADRRALRAPPAAA